MQEPNVCRGHAVRRGSSSACCTACHATDARHLWQRLVSFPIDKGVCGWMQSIDWRFNTSSAGCHHCKIPSLLPKELGGLLYSRGGRPFLWTQQICRFRVQVGGALAVVSITG